MTQYRKPTAADIGKTVEFSDDGKRWASGELRQIHYEPNDPKCYCVRGQLTSWWEHARIPVTTAADELLVAADMLEECGMDGAAEVLRVAAERANKPTPGYWTWTSTR